MDRLETLQVVESGSKGAELFAGRFMRAGSVDQVCVLRRIKRDFLDSLEEVFEVGVTCCRARVDDSRNRRCVSGLALKISWAGP